MRSFPNNTAYPIKLLDSLENSGMQLGNVTKRNDLLFCDS